MKKVEPRYYFHTRDNTSIIGILDTDNGTWQNTSFNVFYCGTEDTQREVIELSNSEINEMLCPEIATQPLEWIKIEKEQISPADRLKIGVILDDRAEVDVFDLPGDKEYK